MIKGYAGVFVWESRGEEVHETAAFSYVPQTSPQSSPSSSSLHVFDLLMLSLVFCKQPPQSSGGKTKFVFPVSLPELIISFVA